MNISHEAGLSDCHGYRQGLFLQRTLVPRLFQYPDIYKMWLSRQIFFLKYEAYNEVSNNYWKKIREVIERIYN